jgi:hypothetical protein
MINGELKRGDILVFNNKITFIFNEELAGNFLNSVKYSNTTYLTSGNFSEHSFLRSSCRHATDEEKEIYKKLIQESRYGDKIGVLELFN